MLNFWYLCSLLTKIKCRRNFCVVNSCLKTQALKFYVIDAVFRENDIPWAKCVVMCTDGARAMAGLKSGQIVFVKDVAPQVMWTYCMLHRKSLVAKEMSAELSYVMDWL